MSAVTTNTLAGFLQVYAQNSLAQFIAQAPLLSKFTTNFSNEVVNGGTAVITRLPTTAWSTPNDLTQGWAKTSATASSVTMTLGLKDYDIAFNELEYSTITPNMLQNTYFPAMVSQLANGIVVDAINTVTSSAFTTTMTVASSSVLRTVGATGSLQYASQLLTQNEVPAAGRFAILSPAAYVGVTTDVVPTYIYGNSNVVQNYSGLKLIDFEPVVQYPRFTGATLPSGGSKYSNSDKLIGIAGHGQGICVAIRQPLDINNGIVQSYTATDASSGISIQARIMYDVNQAIYRFAVVALYGVAAGNTKAIVPIITQSV